MLILHQTRQQPLQGLLCVDRGVPEIVLEVRVKRDGCRLDDGFDGLPQLGVVFLRFEVGGHGAATTSEASRFSSRGKRANVLLPVLTALTATTECKQQERRAAAMPAPASTKIVARGHSTGFEF